MSLRLEMLQVARLAPRLLRDSSELVRGFLLGEIGAKGGFKDRAGGADLYYTVFGIEALLALEEAPPADRLVPFLRSFGAGEGLDLVHIACLARADAALGGRALESAERAALLRRLGAFRAADGGYHNEEESDRGTVYGTFLAFGAYQDLGEGVPDPRGIESFLRSKETPAGGYANDHHGREGTTPATAAAATLLRNLRAPVREATGEWLLEQVKEGGFLAAPGAPLPDLLSTATAIHALAGLQVPLDPVREASLDFVDSLWTNRGGFYGHWADDRVDCEYTYYGLLALGHLSI